MSLRKKKSAAKKVPRDHRAVPLGVGELTCTKLTALATLRTKYLHYQQLTAQILWQPEPLRESRSEYEMYELAMAQNKQQSGFNKAYMQLAALAAITATREQQKRYFKQFFGRLRNVGSEIPKAEERRFYYVPVSVQDSITQADLGALAELPKRLSFKELQERLCRIVLDGEASEFSPVQVAVLREIYQQVHSRYRPLTFRDDDTTSVSIALDYRMLPVEDKDLSHRLNGQAHLLRDSRNTKYEFFLSIASPTPRAERIQIPVKLKAHVIKKLLQAGDANVNSLTLVLGRDSLSVRLVVAKPKAAPESDGKYLVSRDFGYVNTISLSVIRLNEALDQEKLAEVQAFTKEQARKFFTTHALPEGESLVVERWRFSGRNFLNRIKQHCLGIDDIRSWIDTGYNKLEKLKAEIVADLNLSADALLPDDGSHPKLRKFFQLLTKINQWETRRRGLYRKIAALKKCWFGFLSNLELSVAKRYKATVVREDLTDETIKVDDPKYKGRIFNKMINHGSKGQYQRTASGKFIWYGVPEIALPSFYTSQTCTIHAIVDEDMRDGEQFKCAKCEKVRHADEHGADTIGLYLLLSPISTPVTNTLPAQVGSPRL